MTYTHCRDEYFHMTTLKISICRSIRYYIAYFSNVTREEEKTHNISEWRKIKSTINYRLAQG